MSEEITISIPGTTYRVKFGVEGKYYALSLYRGSVEHKTKPLTILRGSSLSDLPEEVENGLRDLLDSEEVYLSPVIVKRVVNNLLDQIPEDGQLTTVEKTQKEFVKRELKVADLINKSDQRAEKKSTIEYSPSMETKFDATADDIGKVSLSKPKPLPEKIVKRDEPVVEEHKPVVKPIEKPVEIPVEKPVEEEPKPIVETEHIETEVVKLDEKVDSLTNELETLHDIVEKSNQEIEDLKEQVNLIKKEVHEPVVKTEEEIITPEEPIEKPKLQVEIPETDTIEESEITDEPTIEPSIDDSES
ncbi:MAG: hypothetical protein FK733_08620 [Asgard group archaeon]|nr:hypothetical protein [Asgard group archaeon]